MMKAHRSPLAVLKMTSLPVCLVASVVMLLGLLAWFRPEYLHAFISHPLGPSLLMVAGLFQVVGILWVWRILKVQF